MSRPTELKICDLIDEGSARTRLDITSKVTVDLAAPRYGEGARGDVLIGHMNGRQVAVKFIRGTQKNQEDAMKRVLREIVVWACALNHENIAQLYGLIYPPGYPIPGIVSSYVEHELKAYATSHPEAKATLIYEVALGVQYLHSRSAIHGDLKPENIRVSANGQVKIIDFGMGKLETVRGFTSAWNPHPRYFAPELLTEEDGIHPTSQSDVYSFAMLMLELLHGPDLDKELTFDRSRPFNDYPKDQNPALIRLHNAIVKDGHRPLQTRYKNVTQGQWNLLEWCWRQDPAQRPSMQQVLTHLPRLFQSYV